MVKYIHKNDKVEFHFHTYYFKEEKIKDNGRHYLVVLQVDANKSVEGIVVKGRIDGWKTEKEDDNYVSEISFLSKLIGENKKYMEVKGRLEKKIKERFKVEPVFC